MSLQPAHDVPLLVSSPNTASERRVTPSWSISHLKTRLEPVTGIPASCQKLTLRIGSQAPVPLDAPNEDATLLSAFPLQPYAEIYVRFHFHQASNRAAGSTPSYPRIWNSKHSRVALARPLLSLFLLFPVRLVYPAERGTPSGPL